MKIPRKHYFCWVLFFLFGLFTLFGCATYKPKTISACQIEEYALCTEKAGISFAADPFDTSEKTKTGFYADLTSAGYYPIQLIFRNDTAEKVMFLRNTVELEYSGGLSRTVRSTDMSNYFAHNKMAYALLGFGLLSYMSAEQANRKMEADWREKEMPEQLIVMPRQTSHGFVYFKLPEGTTIKGSKIKIKAEKFGEKKPISLELTL
jgi:hypothetical protein